MVGCAETALRTIRDWEEFDLFFLETPIWVDKLEEYARLHGEAPMRIACGELQATRFEFAELMDKGADRRRQHDVGRIRGLTEDMEVCRMAKERGRLRTAASGTRSDERQPGSPRTAAIAAAVAGARRYPEARACHEAFSSRLTTLSVSGDSTSRKACGTTTLRNTPRGAFIAVRPGTCQRL